VALNAVGTISSPILNNSMVSDLLRAYNADKETRKDFENPKVGWFEKSLEGLLCHRKRATEVSDATR
jgi:hypothetical protein